jgi:endonuclease III related protein
VTSPIRDAFDRLSAAYGAEHLPPAGSPLEALVGAVLLQNAALRNVRQAISNLREAGVLDPRRLVALAADELTELIRPAGNQQVKTKRLRGLLRLVVERHDGDPAAMFATHPATLREELIAVPGIGPDSADAILLFAGGIPKFVVDTYAHRVAARHGWVEFEADYQTIQESYESGLEPDAGLYNTYHGLLVRVGKEHCKPTPVCEGCPLAELLPEDRSGVRRPLVPETFD